MGVDFAWSKFYLPQLSRVIFSCLCKHWHVLLYGKPPMKFHKTLINCDVFPRSGCFGKLLPQVSYKQANFVEKINLVFCGQFSKM